MYCVYYTIVNVLTYCHVCWKSRNLIFYEITDKGMHQPVLWHCNCQAIVYVFSTSLLKLCLYITLQRRPMTRSSTIHWYCIFLVRIYIFLFLAILIMIWMFLFSVSNIDSIYTCLHNPLFLTGFQIISFYKLRILQHYCIY